MSVYKKLQQARIKLQNTKLAKSGKNKFAGYEYFELSDFLPTIQNICTEVGLCGVVSFTPDMAYLNLYETDGEGCIVFSSPMSTAALKGCHEVQNLGAVQTYLRRYLWTAAFEICEHDAVDATVAEDAPKTVVAPNFPKVVSKSDEPKRDQIVGKKGEWQIAIDMPTDDNLAGWLELVSTSAHTCLGLAKSEDDVLAIFKKNKALFDKVKEIDPQYFKGLMDDFSKVKNKFLGKEAA